MSATDVLRQAEAAGVKVWAADGCIRYHPKDAPSDVVEALRQHKAEILEVLRQRTAPLNSGRTLQPATAPDASLPHLEHECRCEVWETSCLPRPYLCDRCGDPGLCGRCHGCRTCWLIRLKILVLRTKG